MANNLPSLPVDRAAVEQKVEAAKAIAYQRILFGHSSSLLSNDSFVFFLESVVNKRYEELTKDALDASKTSEERDLAVKVRGEIEKILFWAKDTRDRTQEDLAKIAAEEQAKAVDQH